MDFREARFHKRISQWAIALKTKIPQSRISLIERGYIEPKDNEKAAIAKALGCRQKDLWPAEKVEAI